MDDVVSGCGVSAGGIPEPTGEREWCAVCRDETLHGVFQQNGFGFNCCQSCGDGSAIKEEAS